MTKLISFIVLFLSATFIKCSDIKIIVNTSGIKSTDIHVTKAILSEILEAVSIHKTDKSILVSFLTFSKKSSNVSKNARNKIFLQALSELMIDACDNAVEKDKYGELCDSEKEQLDNKILAASNELKHVKDVSMEKDFLEPMMISILEALKYFQPVSDFTRVIIPKISFYCVNEISLSLLFDLILGNMKTAGSRLPLIKVNPEIKSMASYDSFMNQFLLWNLDPVLIPTQILLWNIINGPDTFVSTEILITLTKQDDFVPYLLKRPAEVLPVFRKFAKVQQQDVLLEILNSNPKCSDILKEVEMCQEGYEIFQTVQEIDFEQSLNETLERYNFILEKSDQVFSAFHDFENIFTEEIFIELNRKLFKSVFEFDGISCPERKRLIIRVILNLLKCLPEQNFENLALIDYEPLINFLISQDVIDMKSIDYDKIVFKRLLCLPYSKITESLLFKIWKFHFDQYPTHEAEISTTTLIMIMLRQPPDNASIKLIKIVHKIYEKFVLDFSELISLILFYSINNEEIAYSREIIYYCKERKLLNKTQISLLDAFEAELNNN